MATGLTLLEAPTARASALGEAFSAVTDDAAGLAYNPASLATLQNSQASFLYHRGALDDQYGNILLGFPMRQGGWGLSAGYYDGGTINVSDGNSQRTINSQTDHIATVGWSRRQGSIRIGVAGKYLSSELAETYKATTFAGDVGTQMNIGTFGTIGLAVQNIGGTLHYASSGHDLPRTLRLGLGFIAYPKLFPILFLIEMPYNMVQKQANASAGVEIPWRDLAFRAGYQSGTDQGRFTAGAGIKIKNLSLDFAFGFVNTFDNTEHISISYRFGNENLAEATAPSNNESHRKTLRELDVSAKETISKTEKKDGVLDVQHSQPQDFAANMIEKSSRQRLVSEKTYQVRQGDTLKKISKRVYGSTGMWKYIYYANKNVLRSPNELEVGQILRIPKMESEK